MNESWEPEDVEESQQRRVNTLLPEPQRLRIEADGLFKRAKKAEEKNKAATGERDQLRAQLEVASGNARLYADKCTALEAEVERVKEGKRIAVETWQYAAQKEAERAKALTARAEAAEKDAADCRAEYRELFAKAGAMSDKLIAAESTAAGLRRALEEADKALEQVHDEWAEPTSAHDAGAGQAAAICFAASMAIEAALAASPDEHERRIKSEALLATASELESLRDHIQEYIGPDDARDDIRRICWNRAKDLRAEANRLEAANGR